MKCIFFSFVLCCCFLYLSAPVDAALSRANPHPQRKAGGCFDDKTGHMPGGDKKTISKECIRATCLSDGAIQFESCGKIATEPDCRISADLSKEYPECCPKPIC